jgi:UDP-N-acetylglucosamine 2-epimerase (non-hydrolysing)
MIRVLTVFGTRPEAIKLAPVVRALQSQPELFHSSVCVTAQHREMLDQVLNIFDIRPDIDLDLMRENQSPAGVAASILNKLPDILSSYQPDVLLVQGDTMTTFAASLAAYLQRIPVGHIEAGLRTGNFDHPFPEEMNRCLTSKIAQLHFAPTEVAKQALLSEGFDPRNVFVTGNTVIDALLSTIDADHEVGDKQLREIDDGRPLILLTTHRRESIGKPLRSICSAVARIAKKKPDHLIVIPVHPNPGVSSVVHEMLGSIDNVRLIDPLGYEDFVNLMAKARIILTDSGGIQEEAPALNIPVLVLRETTERPEAVTTGATRLVGTDEDVIVREALRLLDDDAAYADMANADCPYGDGTAAEKIAKLLSLHITPANNTA